VSLLERTSNRKINIPWELYKKDRRSPRIFLPKDDQLVYGVIQTRERLRCNLARMYGNTEVTVAYVSDEVHGKLKSVDFK